MDNLRNIVNIGKQYLSSYTGFTRKIQTLKRKRDTLRSHENDMIARLQHEESSSSKRRKKAVEDWLGNVENTRNKVESMEVEVSKISGILGSVKLSNRVEDLTKEVDELMEQGQVCRGQGLMLEAHEEVSLLTPKLVGQAFQRNLETIWELLRKSEVLIIGVWGMGGVGKTTLVAHVHNRILNQSETFDHVYWITVSQNPSISKLQEDIAKAIRFDISAEDDERKRAAILSRELNKRKRSVLILDDLWNNISLERVGIATECHFDGYVFRFDDGDKYVKESYNSLYNLNEVILQNWSISKRTEEDVNVETLAGLLKDVQSLVIVKCMDARSLSDVWWLDSATQDLKRCYIAECEGIECVGSFSSSSPLFLQKLEILELQSLHNLHILFEMEGEGGRSMLPPSLPVAVFSCLRSFSIAYCHNMKKLFQPGFLPNLQNVEEIVVCRCDGLEEMIASTTTKEEDEIMSSSNDNNNSYHSYSDVQYSLPKLKTLSLKELPILKSIYEGTMACDVLEEIRVRNCPLLQRIPLSKPPSSLQSIYVHTENGEEWWESVKCDDPDAKNLFQPYLKFTPSLW